MYSIVSLGTGCALIMYYIIESTARSILFKCYRHNIV